MTKQIFLLDSVATENKSQEICLHFDNVNHPSPRNFRSDREKEKQVLHCILLPPHAERDQELANLTPRSLLHCHSQALVIAALILDLDSLHVQTIPVQTDKSGDEQIEFADFFVFGRGEGVFRVEALVEEHGVSHWFVEGTVQNMRQGFALAKKKGLVY